MGVFVISAEQWLEHDWASIKVDLLLRTLHELRSDLGRLNIPLRIVHAPRFEDVPSKLLELAEELGSEELQFGAEYEWNEHRRDERVRAAFESTGRRVFEHATRVLARPGGVLTGQGSYYTVFTPFKKALLKQWDERGLPEPLGNISPCESMACESDEIPESVGGFDLPQGNCFAELWPAGERESEARLDRFAEQAISGYKDNRDTPSLTGTSSLSPYLALGMISPASCVQRAMSCVPGAGRDTWISELIWREFYQHVVVGFPRVSMGRSFRTEYDTFQWNRDEDSLNAWKEGRTGIPIVDAAMRQLLETGWMHNRCRMITAMFLSKNLLIDWREGERWFMRHLVDGDLGSNNGGWQWSSSTGTDAAPYFRIFNPISQSQKHDPDGVYIKRHVPELRAIQGEAIHDPSAFPLTSAADYPAPIVDLKASRARAIEAFKRFRDQTG